MAILVIKHSALGDMILALPQFSAIVEANKAAVVNMTKTLAWNLGPDIRVNAVAPGPTLSAMYDRLPESRKEAVMRSVHSGRPARPEEVAQAIVWLGTASPEYVNGTTLDVNDGSYPR